MIAGCRILQFPKIEDVRGSLTFVEGQAHVPFDIRRVYYLYDVPGGAVRGGHAHRELEQVIIAVHGSFDVVLDDGFEQKTFTLRRADQGLYLTKMIWRELKDFVSGSVCLNLASLPYSEADYYRDYDAFLADVRR